MSKLTVILPSLNVVKYIRQCLTSVINQSYKQLDIICVDAGSDDGTLDIIEEFAKIDDRIRVVNCIEKSYGKQVNIALDIALGDYVAIVDTDDFIALDMYEKLMYLVEKNSLDFVKCNYWEHYEFEDHKFYNHKKTIISINELYNCVIDPKEYPQLHCQDGYLWSGIYNLEFLKRKNIRFNTTVGAAFQDVGFFHQVTYYADRIMFIDNYGYYYRIGREGNSISNPNGLRYMLQEYKYLINNEMIPLVNLLQWKYIYKKMIFSYIAECDKKIVYSQINSQLVKPYLQEATNMILECIEKKYISKNDFDDVYWNKLISFLRDINKYIQERKIYDEYKEKLIKCCEKQNLRKNCAIVIFGAGIRGKHLIDLLLCYGINIDAIIDNNSKKYGDKINNIEIVSLNDIIKTGKNVLFIIAMKNNIEDVYKQLIDKNIEKNMIYISKI